MVSLASLGAIIVFINPANAEFASLALFSVVLFLVLFSLLSWAGIFLRRKFISKDNFSRVLKIAFREGVLVSVLGTIFLWLNHFGNFKFWIATPALILVVGLEYFFLSLENKG